jgi:hypothetical protein
MLYASCLGAFTHGSAHDIVSCRYDTKKEVAGACACAGACAGMCAGAVVAAGDDDGDDDNDDDDDDDGDDDDDNDDGTKISHLSLFSLTPMSFPV